MQGDLKDLSHRTLTSTAGRISAVQNEKVVSQRVVRLVYTGSEHE